jgi:hypothetical protein
MFFGAGFPDKFVPSFSWGGQNVNYDFEKACQTAEAMMQRRGLTLTLEERDILRSVYTPV